jgi:uncharacterized protein (TIGR03118 family)
MVEVYDKSWHLVKSFRGSNIPSDYGPFGIQNINDEVYVSYAVRGPDGDDVAGPGNGIVDEFAPDGSFVKEFFAHGVLNSPWGMALAPKNFGQFSNDVLIGNFGDGSINAFDATSGQMVGTLSGPQGTPLKIDKLWGLLFGNGGDAGKTRMLLFSSGPDDENHGLLGRINTRANTQ